MRLEQLRQAARVLLLNAACGLILFAVATLTPSRSARSPIRTGARVSMVKRADPCDTDRSPGAV